jgi:hypothetical protein
VIEPSYPQDLSSRHPPLLPGAGKIVSKKTNGEKRMKSCRSGLILVVAVAALSSLLSAQTYQGRILGSVTDSSGAVVGGAMVTVTNTATRNFTNPNRKRCG